jgi:hypothetical protein
MALEADWLHGHSPVWGHNAPKRRKLSVRLTAPPFLLMFVSILVIILRAPENSDFRRVSDRLSGVEVGRDEKNCGFTRRVTLERALRMAAAAHLKPDNVFTVRQ